MYAKDKILSLPTCCQFLSPSTGSKKFVQYGGAGGGMSIHSVGTSTYVHTTVYLLYSFIEVKSRIYRMIFLKDVCFIGFPDSCTN